MPSFATLGAWRASLLNGLCAVALPLGVLVCIPSAWLSIRHQLWGLVSADAVALCAVTFLYLRRNLAYTVRATIFLAALYLVAVSLLFSLGAMTQIYLLAVPVMATVLMGMRASLLAIAGSTATLFLVGYFGQIELGIAEGTNNALLHWSILSINYLMVACMMVVPCAYLLRGLDAALARLEAKIAALQAAEESNEQKNEFLAMISHEVRTPLGGVIGMLQLAQKDPGLAADTRNKLRISLNNAEILLQIINDILDFSRLEAGKMPLEEIDFDLPALLGDVHALLADRADAKGITLFTDIDPALARWWRGDPTRLRQVAMNLVGNGIKFTEQGEVRLSVAPAPDGIVLSVADTGIGIAPEAIERLFRMFEQASSATSRKYGGTGLGLAICRNIVNAMQGRIDVRSTPGAGTEFTVHLPLPPGQPVPDRQEEMQRPHARRLQILCAEDGSTNQIILRELLSTMGHSVTIAEDGVAALEALAQRDYDLLVLDSRMPRMDGVTALRQLRAGGGRNAALPVLALTANAGEQERGRFLAAGADAFLSKPIDECALHAEVGRLIGQLAVAPAAPAPRADTAALMRDIFRTEAPKQMAVLQRALTSGDANTVALSAHNLLGSSGYFDAQALRAACARVEALADAGQLEQAAAHSATMEAELDKLLARLA